MLIVCSSRAESVLQLSVFGREVRENGKREQRISGSRAQGSGRGRRRSGSGGALGCSPVAALDDAGGGRGREHAESEVSGHRRAAAVRRLWQESGCRAGVEGLLAARASSCGRARRVPDVLHRFMVSGSDRACEHWRDDYHIDEIDGLDLDHLYRAMSWLGEELGATEQAVRRDAPRCMKDLVEERLFERQRDLFSGSRWWSWRRRRWSSRAAAATYWARAVIGRRPAASQPDGGRHHHGSELPAGVLGDVAGQHHRRDHAHSGDDRLRQRFAVGRVCIVADRGMMSAESIAKVEDRGLEYMLGVRER